jgi:hypothetical protein
VGVTAVMVIACWIGFKDRRPALTSAVSWPQGSNALEQQVPVAPAKRVSENATSKVEPVLGQDPVERKTSRSVPLRVVDRNIRVRYFSDDVTVRYFTPKPAPHRVPTRNSHVRYISDDVTVRYFTPNLQHLPSTRPAETAAQQ